MRFVRAYTLAATGEVVNVSEQEIPFDTFGIAMAGAPEMLEMHELGIAENFEPTDLEGNPCSPARHLFLRMERAPGPAGSAAQFRAKAGHELPQIHACPTAKAAILATARAKGPAAIPERAAHWLEYMGSLSGDEMDAAGLSRLTLAHALEFDSMRTKRDPSVGSRAEFFKRQVRARAKDRARGA